MLEAPVTCGLPTPHVTLHMTLASPPRPSPSLFQACLKLEIPIHIPSSTSNQINRPVESRVVRLGQKAPTAGVRKFGFGAVLATFWATF